MLEMNNNGDKVVKKQYLITQKQTVEHYYTVDANSKAEALRMVDDVEVWDYEESYVGQNKAKFDRIILTYECSNKHNGWTDLALGTPITFGWHYNGMCKGVYQDEDVGMCHVCASAPSLGYRPLTQEELQYLNKTYGVVIE